MTDREAPPNPPPLDRQDPFDRRWFQIEGAVHRILRVRLKYPDAALEMLNEIYVRMRNSPDITTILDMKSYALGMARNIQREQLRDQWLHLRLNRRFVDDQAVSRGDADELTPERICDGQQQWARTDRVLEQLPAEDRNIYEARASGETPKAIAESLGLDRDTVYRKLRSTRQWLRDKLGLAKGNNP
ncbi:RNA polymerase sigma factor [Peristeroidobacter soli]|uniref:RNA polymerase sigma factor n=1 Tax=Peristeroidobacter soli TaxID=2497877 RepID=UPI001300232B|nr:sigma-70 family RNA polymerase sigma factor [Peristeroidobacter soli]